MEEISVLGLKIDSTGFVTDATRARMAVQGLAEDTGVLGKALTGAQALLSRGIGFLGVGFGLFKGAQLIKESIEIAARYETLGIVLRRVGQSAGYSASFLNQLTKELQTTGISMKESRSTIISMIQSNMDLANATKLARLAQDAAVTAGLNSSQTLQRITYGIQSAQLEVLRTVGLNVSWEQSYAKLAKQLNKNANDLTQTEKAQARVNAALEAGKNIAGAYEAAMNTASKQMKSMERYAEDLKVKLGLLFQPAYTAVVFGFATALKFVATNIETLLPLAIALASRALVPMIQRGIEAAKMWVVNAKATYDYTQALKTNSAAQYEGTAISLNSRVAEDLRAKQLLASTAISRASAIAEKDRAAATMTGSIQTEVAIRKEAVALAARRKELVTAAIPKLQQAIATAPTPTQLKPLGQTGADRETARQITLNRELLASEAELGAVRQREAAIEGELSLARQRTALATEGLIVADGQLLAATAAATAAQVRATAATRALSLASAVATGAVGLFNKALALVGGWSGAAILAAVYVLVKLASQTDAAAKVTEKYGDALEDVTRKAKPLREEFEKIAKARDKAFASKDTKALADIRKDIAEAQADLSAKANNPGDFGALGFRTSPEKLRTAILNLTGAYQSGTISATTMYQSLLTLEREYPKQVKWIDEVWQGINIQEAAQLALTNETRKGVDEVKKMTEALGLQSNALDKVTTKAFEAAVKQAELRKAFREGGAKGLQRKQDEQSTTEKATQDFDSFANNSADDAVKVLKYRDALKLTEAQMRSLARAAAEATKRPTQPGFEDEVNRIAKLLQDAKYAAQTFGGLAARSTSESRGLSDDQAAADRNKTIRAVQIEINETTRLTDAQREGAAVRAQVERTINGEQAARGLGVDASIRERNAMAALTKELERRKQVLATTTAVSGMEQEISDTLRLITATKQGEEAVRAVEAALRREAAARGDLKGATAEQLQVVDKLAEAQAYKQFATAGAELTRQVEDQTALAAAQRVGKEAASDLALAQASEDAVRKTGLVGLEAEIEVRARLAVLKQQRTANADVSASEQLRTMQEERAQLNAQTEATIRGTKAAQDYAISLAGVTAVKRLAVGTSPELAAQIQAEAEARARDDLNNKKRQEQADKAKEPYINMVRGLQQATNTFLDGILTRGTDTFTKLWGSMKTLFFRALSEMLSATLIKKVGTAMAGVLGSVSPAMAQVSKGASAGAAGLVESNPFALPSNRGPGLAQYGGAAIGGAAIGYGVGSLTTDKRLGTFAGAASGAATGAAVAGPVGAVIGAIAGGVAGFIGSSQKAKAAAQTLKEAQQAFGTSMQAFTDAAVSANNRIRDAYAGINKSVADVLKEARAANFSTTNADGLSGDDRKTLTAGRSFAAADDKEAFVRQQLQRRFVTLTAENIKGGLQQFQRMAEIAAAYDTQVKRVTTDFMDTLNEQIGGLRDTSQYASQVRAADRQNAQLQTEAKQLPAAAQADALSKAAELYALTLEKLAKAEGQRVADLNREIFSTTAELTARELVSTSRDREAEALRFSLGQINELAEATKKWGETNPQIVAQLQAVQAAEKARYEQQKALEVTRVKQDYGVRGAQATGAGAEAVAAMQLRIEQERELLAVTQQWGSTNPEIVAQLVAIQAAERAMAEEAQANSRMVAKEDLAQRYLVATGQAGVAEATALRLQQERELRDAMLQYGAAGADIVDMLREVQAAEAARAEQMQQQAVKALSADLAVRALSAQGKSKEADALRLQIQQAEELRTATEKWASTNPELLQQLKQVQDMERKRQEALTASTFNLPSGYKVERQAYLAAVGKKPETAPLPTPLAPPIAKALAAGTAYPAPKVLAFPDLPPLAPPKLTVLPFPPMELEPPQLVATRQPPAPLAAPQAVTAAQTSPVSALARPQAAPGVVGSIAPAQQTVTLSFGAGSVPITIVADNRPVKELVDEFIDELQSRSLSKFGTTTNADKVLNG